MVTDAERIEIRKAALLEAAEEVASHWNDAWTMVNQKEQARRSANGLLRPAERD